MYTRSKSNITIPSYAANAQSIVKDISSSELFKVNRILM